MYRLEQCVAVCWKLCLSPGLALHLKAQVHSLDHTHTKKKVTASYDITIKEAAPLFRQKSVIPANKKGVKMTKDGWREECMNGEIHRMRERRDDRQEAKDKHHSGEKKKVQQQMTHFPFKGGKSLRDAIMTEKC